MARGQNFYYQDPTAAITDGIAKAIFGDPAAAAQQRQQQAEIHERQSRAGLYQAQANGQIGQNEAAAGLPALLREFAAANAPRPPGPGIDSPEFADFGTPMPAPAPRPDPTVALANLVAAMGVMNGDKVDPTKIMGAYGAFGGDDEMARRSMVAQGSTPGKDFAITPERADEIAMAAAQQEQAKAFGVAGINRKSAFDVATINNRDDIPVANINATARRDVAEIGAANRPNGMSRGERNNNPGNLEFGPLAKSLGATGTDGRFAIFPTYEAGVKAQEALIGGASYVGGGRNTIDAVLMRYAPPSDGNPVDNYADYVSRRTGIARNQRIGPEHVPMIAEAMREFETGSRPGGKGGKSGSKPAADKPPKPMNSKSLTMVSDELDKYYTTRGLTLTGAAKEVLRSEAIANFQQSGNPVQAVLDAVNHRARSHKAKLAAGKPAAAKFLGYEVPGARQAPDGKWYVQTGKKPDGSPSYSRVD